MVNLSVAGGGAPGYGAIRLVTRSIVLPVARCQSERLVGEEQRDLRWGVERRLEFIEFRLFWEGHVNRSDLIDSFGISVQQASTDLNRYLGLAPANMVYDKSGKAYVRGAEFTPIFLRPDASRYLSQLRSMADGLLQLRETWIGASPAFDTTPTPSRSVDAKILRSVVAAIRAGDEIEIKYQSLSRPEPMWRWVAPHAIGFDGFRWHARSYCALDKVFKDFVLSRILGIRGTRSADVDPKADADWHESVVVKIAPHPELSAGQRKIVELDYGMNGGVAEIPVRKALLYYTLRRLGLDTDPSARLPQDQQITLVGAPASAAAPHLTNRIDGGRNARA
jgi:predicted DNA-binding transcriptional regulator YafY